MATLYGTFVYFNRYSDMPKATTNVEYTFSFETSESTIPASNWRDCVIEDIYHELMDQSNTFRTTNSTGILIFIDSFNSSEEELNGNFACNEEAIVLPQNAEDTVSGTLSFIDWSEAQQQLGNGSLISDGCTKTIDNKSISYVIAKTGTNAYTMTWTINETESYAMQKNIVHLVKKDADGTKTIQNIELMPSTIAKWSSNASNTSDAFPTNLTTSNLAPGGICFDINEVFTSESQPSEIGPNSEIGPVSELPVH